VADARNGELTDSLRRLEGLVGGPSKVAPILIFNPILATSSNASFSGTGRRVAPYA
jgi:hypothetical protein